jgi:hypothetical protein
MLSAKEIDRLNSLYDQAVNRYLDKSGFNPSDWLGNKESLELTELIVKDEETEHDEY